jgi:hypothetical protein
VGDNTRSTWGSGLCRVGVWVGTGLFLLLGKNSFGIGEGGCLGLCVGGHG